MVAGKKVRVAFGLVLAALLALAAAGLTACSPLIGFPHTAQAGRVSAGYPEGLHSMDPSMRDGRFAGEVYLEKNTLIANEDYSVGIMVSDYRGIRFEQALRVAQHAREIMDAVPTGELVEKWGITKSLGEGLLVGDPERIEVGGRDAFLLRIYADRPEGARLHEMACCIRIGSDSIGLVYGSFPYGEYEANRELYDRIFASIRVSEDAQAAV